MDKKRIFYMLFLMHDMTLDVYVRKETFDVADFVRRAIPGIEREYIEVFTILLDYRAKHNSGQS